MAHVGLNILGHLKLDFALFMFNHGEKIAHNYLFNLYSGSTIGHMSMPILCRYRFDKSRVCLQKFVYMPKFVER